MSELKKKADRYATLLAPVYAAMGWKWGFYPGEPHVPTAKEISKTIRSLAKSAKALSDGVSSSTGGLTVYYIDDDYLPTWALSFNIGDL